MLLTFFLKLNLSFSSLTYMCRAGAIRTDDNCIVLKVRLSLLLEYYIADTCLLNIHVTYYPDSAMPGADV